LFSPHVPACGDSVIDTGHETCDDAHATEGNNECAYPSTNPCEFCHACVITLYPAQSCGDHIVQAGHEDCEPPSTTTCSSKCKTPTCSDAEQDGVETDLDCGGVLCDGNGHKCSDGLHCLVANDCQSSHCVGTFCAVPTCVDGIKNGGESGVDCGGTSTCGGCAGDPCTTGADCHSTSCGVGTPGQCD